ncbi:hypothetical protein JL720_14438 [Aureococcus anophagefferens]|nr:hypothetical protein JL720_14438 [Aureococcus anophagefferens]
MRAHPASVGRARRGRSSPDLSAWYTAESDGSYAPRRTVDDGTLGDATPGRIGIAEAPATLVSQHDAATPRGGNPPSLRSPDRRARRHFIGIGYVLHCEEHFWQMRLLVFVRGEHAPYASAPDVAHKGCGIGDTLGNKGAIGAAFRVHGTTLCFVCCHLEAFQGEVFGRNSDFSQVVSHHRAPSREIPVAPELPPPG